jgi:AcrR family transcriptional regulator
VDADEVQATEENPYRHALLRQERSRQTRADIVRAAFQLWRQKGYDNTTIEEISALAEVGASTFYYHFPGKDALLLEIGHYTASSVEHEMESQWTGSLRSDLDLFVRGLTDRITAAPTEIVAMVVQRHMAAVGTFRRTSGSGAPQFAGTLHQIFERGREAGEVHWAIDIVELSVVFSTMLMEGILRWALGATKEKDLLTLLSWRKTLLLSGIQSEPGQNVAAQDP